MDSSNTSKLGGLAKSRYAMTDEELAAAAQAMADSTTPSSPRSTTTTANLTTAPVTKTTNSSNNDAPNKGGLGASRHDDPSYKPHPASRDNKTTAPTPKKTKFKKSNPIASINKTNFGQAGQASNPAKTTSNATSAVAMQGGYHHTQIEASTIVTAAPSHLNVDALATTIKKIGLGASRYDDPTYKPHPAPGTGPKKTTETKKPLNPTAPSFSSSAKPMQNMSATPGQAAPAKNEQKKSLVGPSRFDDPAYQSVDDLKKIANKKPNNNRRAGRGAKTLQAKSDAAGKADGSTKQ